MKSITSGNKSAIPTDSGDTFSQRVFMIVNAIPAGKVATYGQIARLAGHYRAARQIGRILSHLPADSALPWHRVVNRLGKLSLIGQSYQRQRRRLEQEKISFTPQGTIDLTLFGWRPEAPTKSSSNQ